jgi:hypothetical protein
VDGRRDGAICRGPRHILQSALRRQAHLPPRRSGR